MARSSIIPAAVLLFASAILAIEGTVVTLREPEHQQLAPPTTHLLLHNNLYTAIRTNVQHANSSAFSGNIVGKYVTAGNSGGGSYNGDFQGTTDGNSTRTMFKYNVNGNSKAMGFSVNYDGRVSGGMKLHGKKLSLKANYAFKAHGTAQGKKVTGSVNGNARLTVRNRSLYYRERGVATMMIGNKSVSARYAAALNNQIVKVSVYGMYDGKKFFAKYSFSMNLLPLAVEMNPMKLERNYGTVTVTAGGKTFTQKYDMKGMPLPQLQ